jgi:uncharacterized protein
MSAVDGFASAVKANALERGDTNMANQGNSDRGFASMDEDKQREIARKGGESVPDEKRSFSRDPQMAAEAGRESGQQSQGGGRDQGGGQGDGQGGRQGGQQSQDTEGDQGGQQRGGQGGGGSGQGGNFANDRERASEAGRKGGQS